MMPNYSMQSHLSDKMGAAAYRLPARWHDYARCIYVAGPSDTKIPEWVRMYIYSEIKMLAIRVKTQKIKKL